MTCHCFSGSPLSSGQFRIKVFLRAVTRGARRGCGRGATHRRAGCGSPCPPHPRVLPWKEKVLGKGSRRRLPEIAAGCARPGSSGHRVPHGTAPDLPKPHSAQRQGAAGLQGTGHGPRPAARRAPGLAHPRCPGPRRPGPRRSSRVVLPPASQVPRGPYLAPGPGASGGGGRGRRPALLPRFRRSQELNIPPLRAAPMRKTSRQQHHLPPGAEPPPAAQPPGTPGPAPSGKARARGHRDPRGCMPRAGPDALAGKGTQEGSRRLWRQGCRCLSWHHQQVLWGF